MRKHSSADNIVLHLSSSTWTFNGTMSCIESHEETLEVSDLHPIENLLKSKVVGTYHCVRKVRLVVIY